MLVKNIFVFFVLCFIYLKYSQMHRMLGKVEEHKIIYTEAARYIVFKSEILIFMF